MSSLLFLKSSDFNIEELSIKIPELETEIEWFEDQLVGKKALLKELKNLK